MLFRGLDREVLMRGRKSSVVVELTDLQRVELQRIVRSQVRDKAGDSRTSRAGET